MAFRWKFSGFARNAISVMHFTATDYDVDSLWNSIDANVTQNMKRTCSSNVEIDQLTFTPLDGSSASVTKIPDGTAKWKGNAGANNPIAQAAVIAKFLSDQRGRSGRGRCYIPWVDEAVVTAGAVDETARAAAAAAWGTFLGDMRDDDHDLVVASYVHAYKNAVTSVIVEGLCGTQRRRQPRP